jgi:hypothetical protein
MLFHIGKAVYSRSGKPSLAFDFPSMTNQQTYFAVEFPIEKVVIEAPDAEEAIRIAKEAGHKLPVVWPY